MNGHKFGTGVNRKRPSDVRKRSLSLSWHVCTVIIYRCETHFKIYISRHCSEPLKIAWPAGRNGYHNVVQEGPNYISPFESCKVWISGGPPYISNLWDRLQHISLCHEHNCFIRKRSAGDIHKREALMIIWVDTDPLISRCDADETEWTFPL